MTKTSSFKNTIEKWNRISADRVQKSMHKQETPIQWHPFKYNPDITYHRSLKKYNLVQIKAFYFSSCAAEFVLFVTASFLTANQHFQMLHILLQAAALLVFLLMFKGLITYLFSGNTLKDYEYHASAILQKTNAFLWLCCIIEAAATLVSMILSFQIPAVYSMICMLCCSGIAFLLYDCEKNITYTKTNTSTD